MPGYAHNSDRVYRTHEGPGGTWHLYNVPLHLSEDAKSVCGKHPYKAEIGKEGNQHSQHKRPKQGTICPECEPPKEKVSRFDSVKKSVCDKCQKERGELKPFKSGEFSLCSTCYQSASKNRHRMGKSLDSRLDSILSKAKQPFKRTNPSTRSGTLKPGQGRNPYRASNPTKRRLTLPKQPSLPTQKAEDPVPEEANIDKAGAPGGRCPICGGAGHGAAQCPMNMRQTIGQTGMSMGKALCKFCGHQNDILNKSCDGCKCASKLAW